MTPNCEQGVLNPDILSPRFGDQKADVMDSAGLSSSKGSKGGVGIITLHESPRFGRTLSLVRGHSQEPLPARFRKGLVTKPAIASPWSARWWGRTQKGPLPPPLQGLSHGRAPLGRQAL